MSSEGGIPATKAVRRALVQAAFTPHSPIKDLDHFAARPDQVTSCTRALVQTGLHIAMYGERGVGKTSLAKMLPTLLREFKLLEVADAVRVECSSKESFRSIWRNVFRELGQKREEIEAEDFGPGDVRYLLQKDGRRLLIVLDEFDRMDDDDGEDARTLVADTIKTLADNAVDVTIMIVGVADTLDLLLGDHQSVGRSLVQVHMPRMSDDEAGSILDLGFQKTDLTIASDARARIVTLAEGLPHFVHLLAEHAGERAVNNDDFTVTLDHVNNSLRAAMSRHDLEAEYDKATDSPQRANLFKPVLLACAYAPRNSMGYFRPNDVIAPLSIILKGREVKHSMFQTHLSDLSSKRAKPLKREGSERNYRFRFGNPLLQAFAKIRAISEGLITEEQRENLEALSGKRPSSPPNVFGPLFGR